MTHTTTNLIQFSPASKQTCQGFSQPIEGIQPAARKHPKKLKARHLSELAKRIIVERYSSLMDFDEVAASMRIPGLTGKTVANVVTCFMLTTRKPPAREVAVTAERRFA